MYPMGYSQPSTEQPPLPVAPVPAPIARPTSMAPVLEHPQAPPAQPQALSTPVNIPRATNINVYQHPVHYSNCKYIHFESHMANIFLFTLQ